MRTVSIFRNNRNQAIRLPKEFEFEGVTELTMKDRATPFCSVPSGRAGALSWANPARTRPFSTSAPI